MQPSDTYDVGPMDASSRSVLLHPVESFSACIEEPAGGAIPRAASSWLTMGDTDLCDTIIEGARGADASSKRWASTSARPEPNMHGWNPRGHSCHARAGVGRMIATHIQPWTPKLPGGLGDCQDGRVLSQKRGWSFPSTVAPAFVRYRAGATLLSQSACM